MLLHSVNILEALEAFAATIELMSKIPRRSTKDKVCRILHEIHFSRDGILKVLKAIEKGEKMDPTEFGRIVHVFNDKEFVLQGWFQTLDEIVESDNVDIPIRSKEALAWLADDKSGIRKTIRNEVNYYDPDNPPRPSQKVKRLVKAIETLNAKIEQLDIDVRK